MAPATLMSLALDERGIVAALADVSVREALPQMVEPQLVIARAAPDARDLSVGAVADSPEDHRLAPVDVAQDAVAGGEHVQLHERPLAERPRRRALRRARQT